MSDEIQSSLKELFKRYNTDTENLHFSDEGKLSISSQLRVVVCITSSNKSEGLVSSDLYQKIGQSKSVLRSWFIESLVPLPLLATPANENVREQSEKLIQWFNHNSKTLRGIFVLGHVDFGQHGDRSYVVYTGSTGAPVSKSIQGCVILPREHSWGNKAFMDMMNRELGEGQKVDQETFYRL